MTYYFILRYLIFTIATSYAAYVDFKSRLIPDYIWIATILLGGPLLALDIWENLAILNYFYIPLIIIPIILLLAIIVVFWRFELMGEADIIFLTLLIILFSFPTLDLPDIYSIPCFLIISIMLVSLLIAIITTVSINVSRNLKLKKRSQLIFPENYSSIKKFLLFIVATPVKAEEIDNLKFLPGISIGLRESMPYIEYEYEVNGSKFIWSTVGIPLITFFVIGLYLHIPVIISPLLS